MNWVFKVLGFVSGALASILTVIQRVILFYPKILLIPIMWILGVLACPWICLFKDLGRHCVKGYDLVKPSPPENLEGK